MGVRSQTFTTVVQTWACDRDGCGEVVVTVDPSARERMEGAPGWARLGDGRVVCGGHAA